MNILRITFGVLSLLFGIVLLLILWVWWIATVEQQGGYVPKHYGIGETPGMEFLFAAKVWLSTPPFYLALAPFIAGIGLVSLKRWGTYLAVGSYSFFALLIFYICVFMIKW